jgi:hypothetical protein
MKNTGSLFTVGIHRRECLFLSLFDFAAWELENYKEGEIKEMIPSF